MAWTRGYIPPETISGGFVCRKIFIPNNPEFVRACWDAYSRLTSPGRWETNYPYAVEIGNAWQAAISMTLETWDIGCDEMVTQEDIDDILARLEELENMQISVNCGGGCGCASSNPCGQLPSDTNLPPGGNPPSPTENSPADEVWLCKASQDVVARYIAFWQQVKNYANGVTSDVLSAILDGLLIFFNFGGAFATLLTQIGQYIAAGLADLEIQLFTELRPAIVSAIRTASTAVEARDSVLNLVWGSNYPWWARTAAYALVSLADWDKVYTVDSWVITGYPECDSGGSDPDDCWLPSGYQLQRVETITESESSEYTVSVSLEANAGSDGCGGSWSGINYVAALDDYNQFWHPIVDTLFSNEGLPPVGVVIQVMVNEAIGGVEPSAPISRVDYRRAPGAGGIISSEEYPYARLVVIHPDNYNDFLPLLESGVITKLDAIVGAWDFETQVAQVRPHKNNLSSSKKVGAVGLSLRMAYICQT